MVVPGSRCSFATFFTDFFLEAFFFGDFRLPTRRLGVAFFFRALLRGAVFFVSRSLLFRCGFLLTAFFGGFT